MGKSNGKDTVLTPSPQTSAFGEFQIDPEKGLGYLDRGSPLPLPRTFAQTKAWATLENRRRLIPVAHHPTKIVK